MRIFCLVLCLQLVSTSYSQTATALRFEDKIRIREAMTISEQYGEKLFKGISTVPFAILLIIDSTDFLINHPNPSPDFTLIGHDEVLKTNIYSRKSKFKPHLLATFPAVNGLSCIVVGTPENTGKNSSEWVITLLHEHFHQYQNSAPGYFQDVAKLNLSGGDETGIWMLNFPFPYDSLPIIKQYEFYTQALHKTISSVGTKDYKKNLDRYLEQRSKLKKILSPADYRYFSLQIWQEGLARYAEYNFLEQMKDYKPSREMSALPDFVSFTALKSKLYKTETNNVVGLKLNETQRICFYSIGFAEGLLLDGLNKSWRDRYLVDKFDIERYSTKFK